MKKIATIFTLMFLLTGVSLSQEIVEDVIIGDFEDYPGQWPEDPNWKKYADGWERNTYFAHGGQGITMSQSTIGATLGNYSLKYECPAELYFMGLDLILYHSDQSGDYNDWPDDQRQPYIDGFFAHRSISMDLTYDPADWDPNMTCRLSLVWNSENGTWDPQEWPDTDTLNPGNTSFWSAALFPTIQTRTITWDITPADHEQHADYGGWLTLLITTHTNGTGSQTATYYLDNIRFTTQYTSYKPGPYDTEEDLNLLPKLYWTPGVFATSHDVYFGTDFNEVNEATADNHPNVTLTNVDVNELAITENLEFSTPYYWRVDDIESSQTTFTGDVWTFNTGRYTLIDDFESYPNTNKANDDSRIFVTWRDGKQYRDADNNRVAGNGTGMTVGTDNKPETDPDFVYHGDQSLPLTYDNTKSPYKSETDRTFDPPYDFSTVNNQALETLDLQILGRYLVNNGYTLENGQYTITGSGNDIYGMADDDYEDEFFFVYQQEPLSGDGSISCKIESVENTDRSAKAGVMIRDGMGPVDPGAVFAGVFSLPNGDIVFQYRSAREQASEVFRPEDHEFTLPYWVRISKDGGNVIAEMSADGENWVDINEPKEISMYNYTSMGLAVTSHRNAGVPCTAVLSDVKLDIGGDTSYTLNASANIGLEENDPADIYVRLEDSSGITKTVNYDDDPNGVFVVDAYDASVDPWRHFSIPLSEFAGVDLTQIKKIVIGIGDGQSVGEGKIYVDDVRLTLPDLPDSNEGE